MNDSRRATIIERVRAMRSTEGRSDAEAEAFIAKAAELALRHQITESELANHGRQKPAERHREYYYGNSSQGVFTLACEIAPVFGCAAVGHYGRYWRTFYGREEMGTRVTMFGRPDDLDLFLTFFEGILLPQMVIAVGKARPKSRATFCNSWAAVVGDRLTRQKRRVAEDEGHALIPIDPEIDRMVKEATGGRVFQATQSDRDSMTSGAQAGRTADVGNPTIDHVAPRLGSGER